MPTPPVTLIHPDRPGDERTVTEATAHIHEKAGWRRADTDHIDQPADEPGETPESEED